MKKKTEASTSKANKLRKNQSEEEEYMKSEGEEEVKKLNKKGSIKATTQKVHDMLGIPMGNMKLEDLQRPSNDPFIVESSSYPLQTGTQNLEHSDHEEKDNDGINKKILGKSGTSWRGSKLIWHACFAEERLEMVETLRDGMNKFNRDQTMFDLCKKYKKMFKVVYFHLDDNVMDEDSNSDGDFDNDNNNNDGDGAPMTDENPTRNEQNANENEKERKGEGGSELKDDGEEVQAEVNNGPEVEKVIEEDNEAAVSMKVEDQNEENMKEKESDKE
ncbi:hypothetical protein Tco_0236963 [Tanacetum coccineum]